MSYKTKTKNMKCYSRARPTIAYITYFFTKIRIRSENLIKIKCINNTLSYNKDGGNEK